MIIQALSSPSEQILRSVYVVLKTMIRQIQIPRRNQNPQHPPTRLHPRPRRPKQISKKPPKIRINRSLCAHAQYRFLRRRTRNRAPSPRRRRIRVSRHARRRVRFALEYVRRCGVRWYACRANGCGGAVGDGQDVVAGAQDGSR
jgi:hypothetical protein